MKILDSYINLDFDKRRHVVEWIDKNNLLELSNINKPCYLPKINRIFKDFVFLLSIRDKKDIEKFIMQFDSKYRNFKLIKDDFVRVLLMLITESIKNKDEHLLNSSSLLLSIKFYGSLLHIFFPKYCSEDVWKVALERLSHKHLIKSKQNISLFVKYISDTLVKKYFYNKDIRDLKDVDIISYIIELRTRLMQSVKSFSSNYYRVYRDMYKDKIKSDKDIEDIDNKEDDRLQKIRVIITNLCNSGEIDNKAFEVAFKYEDSINSDLYRLFLYEIFNSSNIDSIFFISNLIVKEYEFEFFCSEYNLIIRRINDFVFGNKKIRGYYINDILDKMYKKTEFYFMYKNIDPKCLFKFFLVYFVTAIRYRLCFS